MPFSLVEWIVLVLLSGRQNGKKCLLEANGQCWTF